MVNDYRLFKNRLTLYYNFFAGEFNDEQHEEVFQFDTEVEAKAVIKQLDELLEVKEL